jgi:hypothetical protein
MEPGLGYKGPKCPVENCYMRDPSHGGCTAAKSEEAKASTKLMRDAIAIVEIIEEARKLPEWANTYVVTNLDERYNDFLKEAEISPNKLQYLIDHHPVYAQTLANVFKTQELSR